ncbi:universal stress protein [Pseudonocardia lacus]|uniref:universal stress protein n=1 Tax=Pseudonocardia lacus TaxID=2835865 RepID=UPI001BDC3214|nr:universal stress protein [Pseudonocardia lacus]
MDRTGLVVVGIDGSPGSRAAAEHALADAARRGARLLAVAAAPQPEVWSLEYGITASPSLAEVLERVRIGAQEQLRELLEAHPDLAVKVDASVEVHTGVPGDVLTAAAAHADLLVVGHRGRGALASALLGSVGLHCVLHATCPVTVVRPNGDAAVAAGTDTAAARA